MTASFALLVPVKSLSRAKSRLGLDADQRVELMRAFAMDAVSAAVGSPRVAQVFVVTAEPFEAPGCRVISDRGSDDLNSALRLAERQVRLVDRSCAVAAMCADLPALRTEDLTEALSAGLAPRWFVADHSGLGTTLLVAGPGIALDPHFGEGSAARHQASGAQPVQAAVTSLRLDVDTAPDLERARALGVGARTRAVLAN